MIHGTEGIVLKTKEYGEADLIVTFMTKDFGLIHAFAKSPRKTKSRFGSSLEPLTHVRLSFRGRENASLPRLTQSDIMKTFQPIRESYECFFKISALLELVLRCCLERDVSLNMFGFLLRALHIVEKNWSNPVLFLSLKIKLLKITGFAPKLNNCARCGASGSVFYFQEGAILCDACKMSEALIQKLSAGSIRLYESLSKWAIEKVDRIIRNDLLIRELNTVIDSHIKYYVLRDGGILNAGFSA